MAAAGVLAGALAMWPPAPAQAQSPACDRYRAELALIDRGTERDRAAAERQRLEIGRVTGYYRSIGCGGGGLGFFGAAPVAECAAISQRIRALEASYDRLVQEEFGRSGDEARRLQLKTAISTYCDRERDNLLERLRGPFDDPFAERNPFGREETERPSLPSDDEPRDAGGRRTVCVRTCDGGFFPLDAMPAAGSAGADAMCQALCPGTEARAFFVPHGPVALEQAVSPRGDRYADLPNAFRFQKKLDPTCACKKENESWAKVLERAESMLDRHQGDVVVTAEAAEEMSRPRARPAPRAREISRSKPDPSASNGSRTRTNGPKARAKAPMRVVAPAPTLVPESAPPARP